MVTWEGGPVARCAKPNKKKRKKRQKGSLKYSRL